ncbi:MAG TPA: alanine--tRNA ligase [Acidimicrobiales bacterium]|nr:alanine--tRNA ligase [Acidimicrobiales bacterium]
MQAERLRTAFTEFFVERGHTAVAPASLIPNDPSVLFTIAGMVQFKAYLAGEAPPPYPRATTIQPCLRTSDIDIIGTTQRHCTFFEMLGNFSFGDYFKEKAIPWAYEFVTEVLGFDADRLWVTVHESDDEAAEIWPSTTPMPAGRVQRLGEDNFWQMGEIGPCGPSSEIFFDRGPEFGPGGGPAYDPSDRYPEIWNLVFMQYNRSADGTLTPLPKRNIDTGAGLDRLLVILQDVDNVQATDLVAPIVHTAERLTGHHLSEGGIVSTSLRVIGDHSRAFTFLVSDGVFPSNEGRGYVLRRLIRRAVLRANQLGSRGLVLPDLVDSVVETMGGAYPKLVTDTERIKKVLVHEEEAFLRTLRQGTALLENELAKGITMIPGDVAFRLHDTFGFPFEVTVEISGERGVSVDAAGFERAMAEQRFRAKEASKLGTATPEELAEAWRAIRAEHGATEFVGYSDVTAEATVLAVLPSAVASDFANVDGESALAGSELLEVFLDRTPFYAEGGGQVGDTGEIMTPTGRFRVIDTTAVVDGLTRHLGYAVDGHIEEGEEATASIDAERRAAIRRNHTGTHLLHWALRQVLGDHVRQQGSLVAPDRLRFDFSHFGPVSHEEILRIEDLVNREVLQDVPVETEVTTREEAESEGAIAFFGEKYGERVRVVHAGHGSVELCGGTHVRALGMIGPLRIVSERSIASNTRRIEAVTGAVAIAMMREAEESLTAAAEVLQTTPPEVVTAAQRVVARQRALEHELADLRGAALGADAAALAEEAAAHGGVVVARRDGLDPNALRDLALSVRDRPAVRGVGLAGLVGDDGRVALVVAARKDSGIDAREAAAAAAKAVGGGSGGTPELATAGGRQPAGIGQALERLRELLGA